MFKIVERKELNPTVTKLVIEAPLVAKKAQPGQFIIVRAKEDSERIPLTVADYDREAGTVTIIFQIVGGSTMELNELREGESVHDFVGPLGVASHLDGLKKVAVVGGGVGCAIAYPIAKKLHELGCEVHSIVGFRNKDLVILEDEFAACSDKLVMMTDDGSHGQKGVVTAPLEELIKSGENYDEVIAIGPLVMMKFVCLTTKKYDVKTVVSMNPIMIDGTGMCGGPWAARPSSPAWTALTSTAIWWTSTRPCSAATCTRNSRLTPVRSTATCSRRTCSNFAYRKTLYRQEIEKQLGGTRKWHCIIWIPSAAPCPARIPTFGTKTSRR